MRTVSCNEYQTYMDDDRNPDWEPLEEVFKKVIGENSSYERSF